jgi:hypothetical protein
MAKQKNTLAMDFAILMLSMCQDDFLPNVDDCNPDMSDIPDHNSATWQRVFLERRLSLQKQSIESHPLGQYFIERNYVWTDIRNFVMDLKSKQLADTLQILMVSP